MHGRGIVIALQIPALICPLCVALLLDLTSIQRIPVPVGMYAPCPLTSVDTMPERYGPNKQQVIAKIYGGAISIEGQL